MDVLRRVILPFVLVALTIAGLFNTYADATGVEKLAASTACDGATPCAVQMTEFTRSPFAHEYVYVVQRATRVSVKCAREMIFVGDYRCEKH